jgi:hypothetical protein
MCFISESGIDGRNGAVKVSLLELSVVVLPNSEKPVTSRLSSRISPTKDSSLTLSLTCSVLCVFCVVAGFIYIPRVAQPIACEVGYTLFRGLPMSVVS